MAQVDVENTEEKISGALFEPRLGVLLSILYVAIFPSILAYLCWNRGIELIGANRGGLLITLVPVFAAVWSVLFLGESLQICNYSAAEKFNFFSPEAVSVKCKS